VCALQADVKLAGISMAVIQVTFSADSYPEVEFLDNNLTKVSSLLLAVRTISIICHLYNGF
jgi:hypothetical protein